MFPTGSALAATWNPVLLESVGQAIAREAQDEPDVVRTAPHSTPVRRLDEVRAARQPDLRWKPR